MSRIKIEAALKAKGWTPKEIMWEPVSYDSRDGREGGWYIEIDNENCSDKVYKQLMELDMEAIILGYNTKDVMAAIEKMPVYEPIEVIPTTHNSTQHP